MKFPGYFPVNCPPPDAEPKNIIAYRICGNEIVCRADFNSYFELGKKVGNDAKFYGASVFADFSEANQIIKMPAHKNKYLAKGTTDKSCGVIKHTPSHNHSSHFTWWLYEDAKPEVYFQVIEEDCDD